MPVGGFQYAVKHIIKMNLSFKNRIALHYMLATAGVTLLVFIIIYIVAQTAMYSHIDSDLTIQARMHQKEIFIKNDSIFFINKNEWEEREHKEVRANPVFIQIVNEQGKLMDKSPNLKTSTLIFNENEAFYNQFNTKINGQKIRQIQVPVEQKGELKGYILTAMSLEGSNIVLDNLQQTLLILFPIVLLCLFIITRFLAGRSIIPVQIITQTTDRITRNSLNERVPLPQNKDELFTLTSSINELLDRMKDALERERQFTADASHQLRTPLAVLKGTLEVLIRKPRTSAEYEEKISFSIKEIDRISSAVEQLLILARLDKKTAKIAQMPVNLQIVINDILQRFRHDISKKSLAVNSTATEEFTITSDPYYMDLVLENLLSNAIKYADENTTIDIAIFNKKNKIVCQIKDFGIVIPPNDLEHIFNPFFRADALNHKSIKGNGLGLSIAQKVCDLLHIKLTVSSNLEEGTVFTLVFG